MPKKYSKKRVSRKSSRYARRYARRSKRRTSKRTNKKKRSVKRQHGGATHKCKHFSECKNYYFDGVFGRTGWFHAAGDEPGRGDAFIGKDGGNKGGSLRAAGLEELPGKIVGWVCPRCCRVKEVDDTYIINIPTQTPTQTPTRTVREIRVNISDICKECPSYYSDSQKYLKALLSVMNEAKYAPGKLINWRGRIVLGDGWRDSEGRVPSQKNLSNKNWLLKEYRLTMEELKLNRFRITYELDGTSDTVEKTIYAPEMDHARLIGESELGPNAIMVRGLLLEQ